MFQNSLLHYFSSAWNSPVGLSVRLALSTTLILLTFGTPLAWWMTTTKNRWLKQAINTLISLPIVLPPTVLGFYLLLFMGPSGWFGQLTESLGLGLLPFTFAGLLVGSVLYSLPFVVQPIQNAFESIEPGLIEAATTLRASPLNIFFTLILPLSSSSIISAALVGFAHTLGEFGIVLMLGGSIPGKTKVLSIAIYDHVEALEYPKAHALALGILAFSFALLFVLGMLKKPNRRTVP